MSYNQAIKFAPYVTGRSHRLCKNYPNQSTESTFTNMRWFFLLCILLLAATGNAAIFEHLSMGRVAGGVAFNLFIVSLLVIWRSSYFCSALSKARRLVIGHALLMLSAGIGLAILGVNAALANNCEVFMSSNKSHGLRN
jgi:hypothetical protein